MKILRSVSRLTPYFGNCALFYVNRFIVVIHCRPVVKLIRLCYFSSYTRFSSDMQHVLWM